MRKLPGLIASSTFAVLLFGACGGDGGTPVQAPQEPGVPLVLDFSAIAGTWSGWAIDPREGQDIDFWASFDLNQGAVPGTTVGTIEEGLTRGNTSCVADALAVEANDPVYVVEEIVTSGGCPDATVRLEHDPEAGTLTVNWTAENNATGSGIMTRGSDPGPRP